MSVSSLCASLPPRDSASLCRNVTRAFRHFRRYCENNFIFQEEKFDADEEVRRRGWKEEGGTGGRGVVIGRDGVRRWR